MVSKREQQQIDKVAHSNLSVEYKDVDRLEPYVRNARTHSAKQITQIAASIKQFGFTNPILINSSNEIIAGHGRLSAAKQLGLDKVPTIELAHLSDAQKRAYIIADNRLAELAGWDEEILAIELQSLYDLDLDFEIEITGFETAELDLLLGDINSDEENELDYIPENISSPPVTKTGDVWLLGRHKLICGDTRDVSVYKSLMGKELARCIFTDPPYNVKIDGHVCGSGSIKHREFAMASGEMGSSEFTGFLEASLKAMTNVSYDGAIHFVCMDWRHIKELQSAGQKIYSTLKNLVVWKKNNGGMGSFYRSQHELVFVYKFGTKPHVNNFGLGEKGRYRTNVWEYAGVNSFGVNQADLAFHPTVKPVAMVVDAIKDVSHIGDIVLDGFGGSGTTLIAAEKSNRVARIVEIDPHYCDVICRRFEALTGTKAILESMGKTLEEVDGVNNNEKRTVA